VRDMLGGAVVCRLDIAVCVEVQWRKVKLRICVMCELEPAGCVEVQKIDGQLRWRRSLWIGYCWQCRVRVEEGAGRMVL
jgi:hypothetical protein